MNRILLIHHGTGYGGGLIALLGLIKELQEKNKVTVFCIFESEAVNYIRETGVEVIFPKNKIFYKYFYRIFLHSEADYPSIYKFIIKIYSFITYILNKHYFSFIELKNIITKFDVVYLNSTFISDWAYIPKKKNTKVIIHIREPLKNRNYSYFYRFIRKNINNNCDWIVSITEDNSNRVNIKDKTTVIFDPVVINRSNKADKFIEFTDNNYKYFTYLGGSARIKGYEQMINSLSYLNDNIKIFMLGEYDYQLNSILKVIKALVNPYHFKQIFLYKKLCKSEHVIMVGKTHNVFNYYKKSIATISPFSKPHASLPILESFSLGIPVIVSDIKGMDEFVKNKNNGVFFNNNDFVDLADKINYMAKLNNLQNLIYNENCKKMYNSIINNRISINKLLREIVKNK